MKAKSCLAMFAALLLAACGGGGSGGNPADSVEQPVTDTRPIIAATGGTPLTLSSSAVRDGLKSRAGDADTLLFTDIYYLGGIVEAHVECAGPSCSVNGSRIYIPDFDFNPFTYEGVMTRNGVTIGQGAYRSREDDITETSLVYGGWLQHNFFFVSVDTSEDRLVQETTAIGTSIGNASGRTPLGGSAVWKGVMVGVELLRQEGVQGDATLTADFADSNIDAAFTNIHELDTGAARASIMFDDVPFTADGFASRANGRIEGKWYGPNHVEVGGIFERGNTVGAFGAKRQ